MPRLSEHERRDRKIAREIAASLRLAAKTTEPARRRKKTKAARQSTACNWCESTFTPRDRVQKFCSIKCQESARRKRRSESEEQRAKRCEYSARYRAKQVKKKPMPRLSRNTSAAKRAWRTREKHRRQQLRWARANPDCTAEAHRKWKAKQEPELFRQYDRDRYAADPEKKRARSRAHYAENRDAINAKRRAKRAG